MIIKKIKVGYDPVLPVIDKWSLFALQITSQTPFQIGSHLKLVELRPARDNLTGFGLTIGGACCSTASIMGDHLLPLPFRRLGSAIASA